VRNLAILFVACCLTGLLRASEVTTCRSPDKKFALRCVYGDAQPYKGDTAVVETGTGKPVFLLDPHWTLGQVKLVWSPDSQRVAYFAEKGNDETTRLFCRRDSSFDEIPLPDLPSPILATNASNKSNTETRSRTEPISWAGPRDLVLERELLNPAWGRAAMKVVLGFDQQNRPAVRSAEQERVSIIDYFLLLPAKDFEAPLAAWLNSMRTDAVFFLCDATPHNIDEQNGYMRCAGDGAQPEFEVALFRYRDGRPLLALCCGELEGPDSTQLQFFELGSDGKMQQISRSILPSPDMKNDPELGYEKEGARFELPRKGRTILVRAQKGGKILHRFTWNGEAFQNEN
jgi:hypothetical protein